ncbi:flagellin [Pelagibacterium luteolum]|uniref:Flagellin n=1 Tax=Pelagibacterium luteolum TaxID=440168 RepID=A0A1G7YA12_9HYPH|nr:flagellin [Pelagibacterium luteolum]SDG93199.1 Flagellin and related hook-associated protein FlgL [Pelagibacterium luteolum]
MSDVTLSKAVRSNLLHLQNTAKMMDATQERLATGKKVNSALDNPTNFFTAASLNGRAADIGTLLDAMGNGIKAIEAADNGLTAITKAIESMQSTLRQARQDKSFQTASLPMGANRSGELTLSGGGFPAGTSHAIALTNAVPASVTAGADFALTQSRGGAQFEFEAIEFASPNDTLSFDLTIDGVERSIVITKAIADAAAPGGEITTPAEMKAALDQAIGERFTSTEFTVAVSGTDLVISSGSRGAGSSVVIGAATSAGMTAPVTPTSLATEIDNNANLASQTVEFNINYGTSTPLLIELDGNVQTGAAAAVAEINDRISTWNNANPNEQINVTAVREGNRIVLRGPADGTGPNLSVSDGGNAGDLDLVFGTARATLPPSPADGEPKTVDQLVREINANPDFKNIIRASNDNGRLRIENLSTKELDMVGLTNGQLTGGIGTDKIGGNDIRAGLAREFNELRTEMDRLADDASFNGINLLRGDQLKIVFNESGTSTIEIQAKNAKGEERAVNAVNLNILEVMPEDLNLDESIDGLLAKLQVSLNEVRSQASNLGSTLSVVQNREKFTKEMINTLETGAANLTLADSNEEAANMLALQTRQQLSQTALSLASQADQAVLRLFG